MTGGSSAVSSGGSSGVSSGGSSGVSWSGFEAAVPELAAAGHKLLYQYGVPLAFLATVRPDGGPRLHPCCPLVTGGELWLLILGHSPKYRDLKRDPRLALHAFAPEHTDDEFLVYASAIEIADDVLRRQVVSAAHWNVSDDEQLFRTSIERVMLAVYEARGTFPPAYSTWSAAPAARSRGTTNSARNAPPQSRADQEPS
jgi:hypothetical protein